VFRIDKDAEGESSATQNQSPADLANFRANQFPCRVSLATSA